MPHFLFNQQFNNDEDFASNIQNNTPRYERHFEDIADDLLPPSTSTNGNGDIFDFLQVTYSTIRTCCILKLMRWSMQTFQAQRLEQLQRAADPAHMPTEADTPHSLVRRYEVSIIPFSSAKARKLREIKSGGMWSVFCCVY